MEGEQMPQEEFQAAVRRRCDAIDQYFDRTERVLGLALPEGYDKAAAEEGAITDVR